jgi:hypothetical protein
MDISNVAMTQFTSSAVVVYLMQKVKSAKWFPLVQNGRAMLNRVTSIVAAALVSIGISWSWTKDAATGTHTLIIMNIGLWTVLHGFWHWLNQYALQETVYQATANKPGITTDAAGAVPAMVAPGGAVVAPPLPTVKL